MRKITILSGSRADACPLAPLVKLLDCTRIETDSLYGNEAFVLSELKRLSPDILVCLGDRTETLLACAVANSLAIPIAHIHGGEITEGSTDENNRHAISKLSYWHFVSHQRYSERLQKMGEATNRIFVCGAPGVDALVGKPMAKEEVEKELGVKLESPIALVCYHPETLGEDDMSWAERLRDYTTVIISGSNADIGGDEINTYWQKTRTCYFYKKSYSPHLWLSLMHHADVLIGNSSGFIFEGMTMGKKFINISERQKGRYEDAVEFFAKEKHPFGIPGEVSPKIAKILMEVEIPDKPRKKFYG